MAPFRLKPGKKHMHDGRMLNEGEVVDLSETQQIAFRDKFESVSASPKPAAAPAAAPPKPTSHVPQDAGAKASNPNAPAKDENAPKPPAIGTARG